MNSFVPGHLTLSKPSKLPPSFPSFPSRLALTFINISINTATTVLTLHPGRSIITTHTLMLAHCFSLEVGGTTLFVWWNLCEIYSTHLRPTPRTHSFAGYIKHFKSLPPKTCRVGEWFHSSCTWARKGASCTPHGTKPS